MKKFCFLTAIFLSIVIVSVKAQYKVLLNFGNGNYPVGGYPGGSLIISGSKMFGMTEVNIFSVDTNGSMYKDLYDFIDTGAPSYNGFLAYGSLVISGNTLYGMVFGGGNNDSGCIFKIDTNGNGYKKLYDFGGKYGAGPVGDLTLSGGVLYGMTSYGGAAANDGIVFSVDTSGSVFKVLLDFNGLNGSQPWGDVIISGNKLYGMTQYGGAHDSGCIFSISTNGSGYIDILDFKGTNGALPQGALTISGSMLYGMTSQGGTNNDGVIFSFKDTLTGIDEIQGNKEDIKAFPNPSNGKFAIQLGSTIQKSGIEIYNELWEKVYSQFSIPNIQFQLDLSNQPAGIYLYRVISEKGELIGSGKLIIE